MREVELRRVSKERDVNSLLYASTQILYIPVPASELPKMRHEASDCLRGLATDIDTTCIPG